MKAVPLELAGKEEARSEGFIPADWEKELRLLQDPASQILQMDRLFLFELDQGSEQSPLFFLRTETGEAYHKTHLHLDEASLLILDQTLEVPQIADMPHPLVEIFWLVL